MENVNIIFKAAGLSLKSVGRYGIPSKNFGMPTTRDITKYQDGSGFINYSEQLKVRMVKTYIINNTYIVIDDWNLFLKPELLDNDFILLVDILKFNSDFFKLRYKRLNNELRVTGKDINISEIREDKDFKMLSKKMQMEIIFCNETQMKIKIKRFIGIQMRKLINEADVVTPYIDVLPKLIVQHLNNESITYQQ